MHVLNSGMDPSPVYLYLCSHGVSGRLVIMRLVKSSDFDWKLQADENHATIIQVLQVYV